MKKIFFAICSFLLISNSSLAQSSNDNPFLWNLGDNTTLKLGGYVRFCTSLDIDGSLSSTDFNPGAIAPDASYSDESELLFDPTATRFSLEFTQKDESLGDIKIYVESDFRASGSAMRLRQAYISLCGVTAGYAWSFMSDLPANAPTIDIQGVASRTFLRTTLVGYRHNFSDKLSAGISAELPKFNALTSELAITEVNQNIPDVPIYAQYKGKKGHIKAAALLTTMQYAKSSTSTERETTNGFGGQLSGSLKVTPAITLYGQGIYGEGIGRYINAISSYDVNLFATDAGEIASVPMYAASLGINGKVSKKVSLAASYAIYSYDSSNSSKATSLYGDGDYLSATIFYSPAKRISLGAEFLSGSNQIMGGTNGTAQRVSLMVKYTL